MLDNIEFKTLLQVPIPFSFCVLFERGSDLRTHAHKQQKKERATIVCVFPEWVCPYANMETLYPSKADCTSGWTSLNNSAENRISKVKQAIYIVNIKDNVWTQER